ncbi:hypothetical protein [Kitasatospora sp. NPDC004531]
MACPRGPSGPNELVAVLIAVADPLTPKRGIQRIRNNYSPPVEEIEFSVRPEHVLDGAGVASVLRFLVEVATAGRRPALLTGETVRYDPRMLTLISHDPATGLTAHI